MVAGNEPVLVHNCGGSVRGHDAVCTCATGGPPVGPINAHLAGSTHPVTGIPFAAQGFPDFSAWTDPTVPDVRITLTGDRQKDFRLADQAAGINAAYRKGRWTWNHHQDCAPMQLVDVAIHSKTGHTGGHLIRPPSARAVATRSWATRSCGSGRTTTRSTARSGSGPSSTGRVSGAPGTRSSD
ncbi:HNH endonuclease [Micromonospora sp. MP36]|nr:HNH endonuclease [Micromonospora sp. MP36]